MNRLASNALSSRSPTTTGDAGQPVALSVAREDQAHDGRFRVVDRPDST